MVKIKRKVKMTLPELIEWGFKNNIKNREFSRNHKYFKPVVFNSCGYVDFRDDYAYSPEDTFTVEVEEEITEDTKLDLVERFVGSMGSVCYTSHNMSIKECLKLTPRDCTTTHFYIENGDRELILIWCDGKMVD